MEEEVRSIRCKGEEEKGRHTDGSRIDTRGYVLTNGVEGVEEGIAPIDPSLTSILKGGGASEDAGKESATGPTRSSGTPASSLSRTGLAYWARASFYHRRSWSSGRAASVSPSSYYWPTAVWDASRWRTMTTWRCPTSTGRSYTPRGGGELSRLGTHTMI